jgi:hypothetical protein
MGNKIQSHFQCLKHIVRSLLSNAFLNASLWIETRRILAEEGYGHVVIRSWHVACPESIGQPEPGTS